MPQKPAINVRSFATILMLLAVWALFAPLSELSMLPEDETGRLKQAVVTVVQGDSAYLSPRNLTNIFRQMCETGALAIGMVLIIACGNIDLSVGSLAGFLGGLAAAATAWWGWPDGGAMAAALGAGLGIGLINGILITKLRIPSFIVTLGGLLCFRGLLLWVIKGESIMLPEGNEESSLFAQGLYESFATAYLNETAGWLIAFIAAAAIVYLVWRSRISRRRFGLSEQPLLFDFAKAVFLIAVVVLFVWIVNQYKGIPVQGFVLIALALCFTALTMRTRFGRYIYAVGGNAEAARLSGIRTDRVVIGVYALMGLLCAVAGMMLASKIGVADVKAGEWYELNAIAACVIGGASLMGGRGTVIGALLGALIMESINNGMSMMNMESHWQYVVKGAVLVAAVALDVATRGKRAP